MLKCDSVKLQSNFIDIRALLRSHFGMSVCSRVNLLHIFRTPSSKTSSFSEHLLLKTALEGWF